MIRLAVLRFAARYQNETLTVSVPLRSRLSSLASRWIRGPSRRCYFHLVNGHEIILDDNGIEVPDLATAEEMALHAIDDLRNEALQPSAS